MIDIHVHGTSWPEVTQELRQLLGDEPTPAEKLLTDEVTLVRNLEENLEHLETQLAKTEEQLNAKCARIAELEEERANLEAHLEAVRKQVSDQLTQMNAKDVRITALEKQLADAKAPQQAEPTEGDTEAPAPDEEEQTEIPEVTEAPVKEYKKEEVRAVLMECRSQNIAISDILAPYGGSLGAVKKEDYAKVVEAAEAALEGK